MKETTIYCDACRRWAKGTDYSTLWARLRKRGWVLGYDKGTHYCPKCVQGAVKKEMDGA